MPRYPIIGITGLARSGKDTVASFLIPVTGGYRYALADPIRAMLVPFGVDMADPYWQTHKEDIIPALGVSPRYLMQTLGTEWGRQLVNENVWLLLAQQRVVRFGPGMVVTDIRFENEADWVRKHGGIILHVLRKEAPEVELHASEAGVEIKDSDLVIHNNGTLEELQQRVTEMFGDGLSKT